MKFTLSWLKDHLNTKLNHLEIADMLINLGIEVEEIIDNNKKFEKFIVGFIRDTKPHPNADKLKICEVVIGENKTLNIVCGAKNARVGIYVALAQIDAYIPLFKDTLKKGIIRGIESEGMLCSYDELELTEYNNDDKCDGIIELSTKKDLIPGQSLASALDMDDIIFDVSITPNRADCFNVRGIARDLSAAGAGNLKDLVDLSNISENNNFENPMDVEIKTENCDYFSTLAIKNVNGKTPDYIAKRLKAISQNLVDFTVDIANYICIDIGQPMHIFDINKLSSKLIIRDSKEGEKINTLDNKETTLPANAVVISDDDRKEVLSIAGIMGGESTAISKDSTDILIESAYFNKIAISKTGQKLRLTSDSRMRFERGINPETVDFSIRYAAYLICKNCKSNPEISNIKKYGKLPTNKNIIELNLEKFKNITNLNDEDFGNSVDILKKLEIKIISIDNQKMVVETPSHRHDLNIEEDIIEEILRITGYENIKEQELDRKDPIIKNHLIDKLTNSLVYNGYHEVKTFSFIDKKTAELFDSNDKLIPIKTPLTVDFSILRPSVIASHLKSIKNSQNKSQKNSRIFEVGKSFKNIDNQIVEENMLVLTISEKLNRRHWRKKQEDVSIFDIKEILERILNISLSGFRLQKEIDVDYYHPTRSGSYIFQKDTIIARFGEIHPNILQDMSLNGPVVCCEIFLDRIQAKDNKNQIKKAINLSKYQPINRDFSFVLDKSINAKDILDSIKKLRIEYIKDISIFDIYESKNIGDNKKAVAFEIAIQSDKKTLDEEEISEISQKIIDIISKNHDGVLRDK